MKLRVGDDELDAGEYPHIIEAILVRLIAGKVGGNVRLTLAMDFNHPGHRLYMPNITIAPSEARELADALLRLATLAENDLA